MPLPYTQTIEHCLTENIGQAGVLQSDLSHYIAECADYVASLKEHTATSRLLSIPYENIAETITPLAKSLRKEFSTIVVLGTGGSTLNPQTLVALGKKPLNVCFLDCIDPYHVSDFLEQLPLRQCAFLSISKSGHTLETVSQTLVCLNALEKAGMAKPGKHLFVITQNAPSPLHMLAKEYKATILEHPSDVSGRFATFTSVGLLPAAIAGVDVQALTAGACTAIETMMTEPESPIQESTSLAYAMIQKKMPTNVLMPYSQALQPFSAWHNQIWSESLGKNGKGSTPIRAIGTLDQHSQLQLYLDGPKDKYFTIIAEDTQQDGAAIHVPDICTDSLDYMTGKTIGDLHYAAQQATMESISQKGKCPVRSIEFKKLDAFTLGALCWHMTLETILIANWLKVNPFDQPAVEHGKKLTRAMLASEAKKC